VLVKYGLSEAVLEVFGQLLDQFDAAMKLGNDGRAAHTGATKRLQALALEAGKIVRAMDARNPVPVLDPCEQAATRSSTRT
jgi:hypothetical protein